MPAVLADPAAFFGPAALQDPYPFYARMHAAGPVHRLGESEFYLVAGWDALLEVLARVHDFSSNLTATMVYHDDGTLTPFHMAPLGDPSHALATADDPVHALHRKLLIPHLAAKRLRAIESFVAETADRLWAVNARCGRIEWMSSIANRLPMMVVARLIGVPDDDVDQLTHWAYATTTMLDGIVAAEQLDAAAAAAMELGGYVIEHFGKASTQPRPTLLSDLAGRCAAGDLEQLHALGIMLTLFSAGGESTASLLGSAAWILASRADIQRQVRDRPALLEPFIEEVLRYEPPFRGHYRHVRRDTTLAGVALPADAHLLLLWGAANRDPAKFDRPGEFRLDRPATKNHLAFGRGVHFCVGAALARLEARVVLMSLLKRTTWIETDDIGEWLPSILVRRLHHLRLIAH
ncbi:MAG TPA: cytochrome P450 [Mycobacterium sp.]|uniref:cytochrome P450 n=1 Tax=Mycobacterium sp. TaxID=1785 RepID=UPI002D4961FB|nr:cytochrome P450 [Mycobacterium sp.]HZU46935.1 cytochrome P450 [Mycobacterium sp.]